MQESDLRTAFFEAAKAAFDEYGTLSTPDAREELCQAFLRRWVILTDNILALDPKSASGSHFLLLWKNLSITNISLIELLSLIRKYSYDRINSTTLQVDFLSADEYKAFFRNIWESLFDNGAPSGDPFDTSQSGAPFPEERVQRTVDRLIASHRDFFNRTIIFDAYYTSALVHIPLSVKVDIRSVTIESGYVHSSGIALYFRNLEKAEHKSIILRLSQFFKLNKGTKYFVTPYAAEFFEPFENKSSASTRNGLDGVRLQLRKHYIESESLLNFLTRLKHYFPENIFIPSGVKDYTDERNAALQQGVTRDCTIWFVTDSGFIYDDEQGVVGRNKDLYIVIYAQYYFNNNQLNIFKERKPGWIASTTLPHTLSAAMTNIVRHYHDANQSGERTIILDPFCGTGTTLLDSSVRFPNAAIIGLDNDPMMPSLVRDNFRFFGFARERISRFLSELRAVSGRVKEAIEQKAVDRTMEDILSKIVHPSPGTHEWTPEQDFESSLSVLVSELRTDGAARKGSEVSDAAVSRLSAQGFSTEVQRMLGSEEVTFSAKIIFYLLWRALLMNTFSMRDEARSAEAMYRIFLQEFERCVKEYADLERLLRTDPIEPSKPFCERRGSYSRQGSINSEFIRAVPIQVFEEGQITKESIRNIQSGVLISCVKDSMDVVGKFSGFADIVITDPPYGFNAVEGEINAMQSLYSRLIPVLIKALRPKGQIIMALPAFAKNGKQIPYYQTRESIIRQIICGAEALDRHIIKYVETVPSEREVFDPPWYWGSLSTLERRLIHFIVE